MHIIYNYALGNITFLYELDGKPTSAKLPGLDWSISSAFGYIANLRERSTRVKYVVMK